MNDSGAVRRCAGVIVACGIASGVGRVAAQVSFQGLGTLNTGQPGASSRAIGVSADGMVVAGSCGSAIAPSHAFRWTSTSGLQDIGVLAGESISEARAISADGLAIVGLSGNSRSFRWMSVGGMEELVGLPGGPTAALGVSGNGSIVVGVSGGLAFRWIAGSGAMSLGTLPGASQSTANAVSADGVSIVGESGSGAFRWTAGKGMQPLPVPSWADWGSAHGVSGDGSVMAGLAAITGVSSRALRWTAGGAMLMELGDPPVGESATAQAVSQDGWTIGGWYFPGAEQRAMVWIPMRGLLDVNTYLAAHGVNLTGWLLLSVTGVSADGSVLVGDGNHNGLEEAWVARLPSDRSCSANCDQSTLPPVLNVNDYICFLTGYAAGSSAANCDGSTAEPVLSVTDFMCFIGRYGDGCAVP